MLMSCLNECNDFLSMLLDNIPSAIFIVDQEMRIQSVNGALKQMLNKNEAQVLHDICGNALGCLYAVEQNAECGKTEHCDECQLRNCCIKAFNEGLSTFHAKLEREFFLSEKPVNKHFEFAVKPFFFQGAKMVVVIVEDVTESEVQKQQLRELNELKNKFLGIAAHDLRNPISSIKGCLSLLAEESYDSLPEHQKQMLNIMSSACKKMHMLINNLLDTSAIEDGHLDLESKPVDLNQFIEECRSSNAIIAEGKGIQLDLDLEPSLPTVYCDYGRVSQVIDNLVGNAVKFSLPGTRVRLKAEAMDSMACISVIDEGPGIPEEEIPAIFSEYGKSSVHSTSGERSTGLGLAISKRIIEAHGGRIWLDSQIDQGSTFRFSLPFYHGGDGEGI